MHLPVQVCLNKLVKYLKVNFYRDRISEKKTDAYCLLIHAFQMRILLILVAIVQTDVIAESGIILPHIRCLFYIKNVEQSMFDASFK